MPQDAPLVIGWAQECLRFVCRFARRARGLPVTLLDRWSITPTQANSITAHGTSRSWGNLARSMPRYRRGVDQFMLRPDSRSLPTFPDPTKPEKKGDSETALHIEFCQASHQWMWMKL
jgi:hypothetical protein